MSETVIGSVAAVVVVAIICVASVYGCMNNNQQYYRAMSQCIASGGSAVPVTSGPSATIACIRSHP